MVTAGVALQTIIGPANERWDHVALVECASRELSVQGWEAFADEETRAAAFADTRIIAVRLTT
jgi:hypothetical protein